MGLHAAILNGRIALYKSGAIKSVSLGAATVSVGNLTVGGTGKTPLVAFIAAFLASKNGGGEQRVCVVSRGYKRANPKRRILVSDGERILTDARQAGDEPFELARKLLGKAIVISDANRVASAHWAREKFAVSAFVLDDAFQHLRARRDADIVVVDATNPFGNRKLLPFGILREPLENLKRADAVVITRANLAEGVEGLRREVRLFNRDCPIFITENRILNLTNLEDFFADEKIRDSRFGIRNFKLENPQLKVSAFCALGNPQNFYEQLKRENLNPVSTETFPDHHFYRRSDIEKIEKKARRAGAEILLTTAKDAVKLKDARFALPCFAAEVEMVFAEEKQFCDWLTKRLAVLC